MRQMDHGPWTMDFGPWTMDFDQTKPALCKCTQNFNWVSFSYREKEKASYRDIDLTIVQVLLTPV